MEKKNISFLVLVHDIYRDDVQCVAFETLNYVDAVKKLVELDEMEIHASIEVDITTFCDEGENDT